MLGRGEDSSLVHLMRAVECDPNRVLILTTRDYRLRKAQQTYEKLSDPIFESARLTVRDDELSEGERVHILHNQLHYSPLGAVIDRSIDFTDRFTEVVRHRNYNPRVIEMAIEAELRDSGLNPARLGESSECYKTKSDIAGMARFDVFQVL